MMPPVSGLLWAGIQRGHRFVGNLDPEAAEVPRGTAPGGRRADPERFQEVSAAPPALLLRRYRLRVAGDDLAAPDGLGGGSTGMPGRSGCRNGYGATH